ncbi:MAG TPA: cupin domain-containing protein [Gemmatimonadales bacterium]|jgi:quercetin dioxygenase-like cupin family protein|nr:cupin domain-containing protein [Gemmatimonadales bacterium]
MSGATKHRWDDVRLDDLSGTISRKMLYTDKMMIAQVFLKKGAIVPAHEHHNEQITYILDGCLRFWLGAHADAPGDEYVDIHAGEVLLIPSNLRHRAEALEETLDLDVFNPPREDWIAGADQYLRGK